MTINRTGGRFTPHAIAKMQERVAHERDQRLTIEARLIARLARIKAMSDRRIREAESRYCNEMVAKGYLAMPKSDSSDSNQTGES
jgi:hypothetical protein